MKWLFGFMIMALGWLSAPLSHALTVPLNYATGVQEQTVLRGESQSVDIPFELLQTESIETLELTLAIYNNNPILSTQLWLFQGGHPLAKVLLEQVDQCQYVNMVVPRTLFSGNDAVLTLQIKHTIAEGGEWLDSSELTTIISNTDSFYRLMGTEEAELNNGTLATFEKMLRNGYFHRHQVVLQPANGASKPRNLHQAALLVQGLTLRAGFELNDIRYQSGEQHLDERLHQNERQSQSMIERKNEDRHGTFAPSNLDESRSIAEKAARSRSQSQSQAKPNSETLDSRQPTLTIWYGTDQALLSENILDADTVQSIQGAYIGLHPNSTFEDYQLVVSGRDEQELQRAIHSLTAYTRPFPSQKQVLNMPALTLAERSVAANVEYPISTFTEQRNLTGVPLQFKLQIPSNVIMGKEEFAKLNLLLNHPQVKPGQGNLVVRVDGQFASSVRLRSSLWRSNQHYRLNLPMRMFKSGVNQVSIEVFGPAEQSDNPQTFSVLMDKESNLTLASWIDYIPSGDNMVSSRDLLALGDDFGASAQVLLNVDDPQQRQTLWKMLSLIALSTEQPLPYLLISDARHIERPFSIDLNSNAKRIFASNDTALESQWGMADVRHALFTLMVNQQNQTTTEMEVLPKTHDATVNPRFAQIYEAENSDWYGIALTTNDTIAWQRFLEAAPQQPEPKGMLTEQVYAAGFDQVFTTLFWGYPALLTLMVIVMIWLLSWMITRTVEKRT